MKQRNDFVSNSSSSSFIVAIDKKNHDKSKWLPNTLKIQKDNDKIQMKFGEFTNNESFVNNVNDNWRFVCTQLLAWIYPGLINGEEVRDSKEKILRTIANNEEFNKLNDAVKRYFHEVHGIDCQGVEFDPEDLRIRKFEDEDYNTFLVPDCEIDHDSIYDGFDDMLKQSGCASIEELIWGVKEIRITWG